MREWDTLTFLWKGGCVGVPPTAPIAFACLRRATRGRQAGEGSPEGETRQWFPPPRGWTANGTGRLFQSREAQEAW